MSTSCLGGHLLPGRPYYRRKLPPGGFSDTWLSCMPQHLKLGAIYCPPRLAFGSAAQHIAGLFPREIQTHLLTTDREHAKRLKDPSKSSLANELRFTGELTEGAGAGPQAAVPLAGPHATSEQLCHQQGCHLCPPPPPPARVLM